MYSPYRNIREAKLSRAPIPLRRNLFQFQRGHLEYKGSLRKKRNTLKVNVLSKKKHLKKRLERK